ncbi:MAG: hypothetical protein ACXW6R_22335 [Candidatus Binatia bacterium]
MSNVLNEEKQQQIIVLGRLGWRLQRIEQQTGVRRETVSAYLRQEMRPPPLFSRGSSMRTARTTSATALARLRLLKNVISKSSVSEQTFTIYTLG